MRAIRGMAAIAIAIAAGVSGCANESGARMGLFSATAPVIAMLHDDLFTGTVTGYVDRTGTIEMASTINASLRCMGSFQYTGSKVGSGHVTCNDGTASDFQFNALTTLSGYGMGITPRGPLTYTFGLTPEEATKYLSLPKGKTIQQKDKQLKLV
jgi:hypothetical protein